MLSVCIIQPVIKSYRVPFFIQLSKRLSNYGIKLTVLYAAPSSAEAMRSDNVDLRDEIGVKAKGFWFFNKILFIFSLRTWLFSDLVIVEHANKNILNYILAFLRVLKIKKLAYWGHGQNRQGNSLSFAETLKRISLHWADWWFAYTEGTGNYLVGQGFDKNKITIVRNSIDISQLRSDLSSITGSDRKEYLAKIGWDEKSRICIYCGGLYGNKRLDLLFSAGDLVYKINPDFRLLIVGDGPLASWVSKESYERSWVLYVGSKFGRDKAIYLSLSEMWLNPGLVGLGILDAFSAGIPLLTTNLNIHSPEIEYLKNEFNGMVVSPTANDFASGILELLKDRDFLNRLKAGAIRSANDYSIEIMAENYCNGIIECLKK